MSKRSLSIKQIGLKKSPFHDVYYKVIKSSWSLFMLNAAIFYLALNFLFALVYYYSPAEILNATPHSLWDAFIFSFQTSSTLGYGYLLPQSDVAHAIVILDTMVGIFYVAIITGLAFSKFSRPQAKILFSDKAILSSFDGHPAIMFRLANNRDTHIVDAQLNVAGLLPYTSTEGHELRRFYSLDLMSNNNPTFSLSWTAIHIIKEGSPLFGKSLDSLIEDGLLIFVSFTGIDDVLSQNIHANHRYNVEQIVKAKKFSDVLTTDKLNSYTVDFRKFHDVEV
ncbi:MAG: hypothetical protein KC493_13950 [Bacteriovoracaceae bacterium]|nr:hypothetical protein [Bacteriovoracaceae bacterium]